MGKLIFLGIIFFLFLTTGGSLFATLDRPSLEIVEDYAIPCLPGGNGISRKPELYACPIGEFSDKTGRGNIPEIIKCSIQISLSFESVDKKGDAWAKELQKMRKKDFNEWNEEILNKTVKGPDNFQDQYNEICDITNWTYPEPGKQFGCAKTLDFFPETACRDMAKKRITALQNVGYIFAAKGTAKSFQNDKDAFLDKQKTAYDRLVDKWNVYKRRVGNAVSKFNAYIKQAVK